MDELSALSRLVHEFESRWERHEIKSFQERRLFTRNRLTVSDIKPGRYRHFKGGEYQVIGVAKDSESLRPMVVYRALYGEGGLWVRSLDMFTEIIERNGATLPRFQFIDDRPQE